MKSRLSKSKIDSDNLMNFQNFEEIGLSEQRRPLIVQYLGNAKSNSSLRVFIIAGQHGDERYGRKATQRFIDQFLKTFESQFPLMSLAVLVNANPDGSSIKNRTNAIGIDLNRDHLLLDSKETLVMHSFVNLWKPHVIIDVHNYPSKRKHLLKKNIIFYHDVFIDVPTNPTVQQQLQLNKNQVDDFIKHIQDDLKINGHSCERYVIINPSGRVRHGTPDITDARNFLSLRYDALTVLLEGRNPTKEEGKEGKEQIISAQYLALISILHTLVETYKKQLMRNQDNLPSKGDKVAISSKYVLSKDPFKLTLKNTATNKLDEITLSKYTPDLQITKYTELPTAYAVPIRNKRLMEALQRHEFIFHQSDYKKIENIEYYVIESFRESSRANRTSRKISLTVKTEQKRLENYALFPVNQKGGNALAVFLEPQSKYGLTRYKDMNLISVPNSNYPILRIL